jgi:uncharacterized protein YndB with AHSA1/START domain
VAHALDSAAEAPPMFTVERTTHIARPASEVFAYLADPHNIPAWRPSVLEVVDISGAPAVGATFGEVVSFMGRKTYPMRVTAFEPPTRQIVAGEPGPPIRPTQTYTVTPEGDGSRVTVRADVTTSGFFRLLEPLFPMQLRKLWDQQLALLKSTLER